MSERAARIHISIELHVSLTVDDVWPDGDAPDEITEDAVRAVMVKPHMRGRRMTGCEIITLAEEWSLSQHATLQVSVT